MERHVSATEAGRTFSDLLNRVRYRGESFIVDRGGEPICRISPVSRGGSTLADLVRALKTAPKPGRGYLDDVEKVAKRQPRMPKDPWAR